MFYALGGLDNSNATRRRYFWMCGERFQNSNFKIVIINERHFLYDCFDESQVLEIFYTLFTAPDNNQVSVIPITLYSHERAAVYKEFMFEFSV